MSLQHAANHLAAHGRGPDTTLVHMTKDEVKSLNALAMAHGGHLTINPHTGLPEAGFLSAILPMAAGFALGPAGFGLMSAGAAGMTVGAVTGLASGSLSKGLMAGMGAYGGAGLGDALAKSGMEQAAQGEMAQNAAMDHNAGMLGDTIHGSFGDQGFGNAALQNPAMAAQQVGYGDLSIGDKLSTVGQGVKSLGTGQGWSDLSANAGGAGKLAKYGYAAMTPVLGELSQANQPKEEQEQSSPNLNYKYSSGASSTPMADKYGREKTYYGSQYTPYAEGGKTDVPGTPTDYSYDPTSKSYSKISKPSQSSKGNASSESRQSSSGGTGEHSVGEPGFIGTPAHQAQNRAISDAMSMLAPGLTAMKVIAEIAGLSSANGQGFASGQGPSSSSGESSSSSTGSGNQAAKADAISNSPSGESMSGYGGGGAGAGAGSAGAGVGGAAGAAGGASGGYIANQHFNHHMASGGLSDDEYNLGSFSDGGRLLRGPGDGVSDSIPAVIGKKQPARLADGEFVVPARIVSELGNGSTEAGARKLYSMMDRIQSARGKTVGKGRVAKNSKSEQYLPA